MRNGFRWYPGEGLRAEIAFVCESRPDAGTYLGTAHEIGARNLAKLAPIYLPRPLLPPENFDGKPVVVQAHGRSRNWKPVPGRDPEFVPRMPPARQRDALHVPARMYDALDLHDLQQQANVRGLLAAFLELRGPEITARQQLWQLLPLTGRQFIESMHSAAAVDICGVPEDVIAVLKYNGSPPDHSTKPRRQADDEWRNARRKAQHHLANGRARLARLGFWPWAFCDDTASPWEPADRQTARRGEWWNAITSADSPTGNRERMIAVLEEWRTDLDGLSTTGQSAELRLPATGLQPPGTPTDMHVERMKLRSMWRILLGVEP